MKRRVSKDKLLDTRPPPIGKYLNRNELESIIDEEIVNKFQSIRNRRRQFLTENQSVAEGSSTLVLPQKSGRTSPQRRFKVELVCSKKQGVKG